jgi:hypothetical protein
MTDDALGLPEYRETVQVLERGLPRVALPEGVLDRVLERIEAETPSVEAATGEPGAEVIPFPKERRWRAVAISAGAAAVAVAASVMLTLAVSNDDLGSPAVQASIASLVPSSTPLRGDVELFDPQSPGGTIVVHLENLPVLPAAHHYELWVLPEGSDEMISVGTFTPDSSTVTFELPLPGPAVYAAVDLSVEEDDGPPEHSGTSVAGARLA